MATRAKRPSLVDSAEQALRDWLAHGGHRSGDRLPPEHELSAMLGVSRGTLRLALQRLESAGEIARRQGSGTFVASVPRPTALDEGLERLESYTSLARRRGVKLTVDQLVIERNALAPELAQAFGLDAGTIAPSISRVLLADGTPAAIMVDTVHPEIALPSESRLRRAMERGEMVLDVLVGRGLPIAYSYTRIAARVVSARQRDGKALALTGPTAVLELDETFHLTSGEVVQHSIDLFAPSALDLHVIRWLEAGRPAQINPSGDDGRSAPRRRPRARR
ncbi:MAG TPA: GntR family transcriptional regulator [Solirubrobacteraceae bacterium]|nr:GntR family transcriptional regulator [Solirubrobacteraceae bacterium]